jgi:hypothetical protein
MSKLKLWSLSAVAGFAVFLVLAIPARARMDRDITRELREIEKQPQYLVVHFK